MAISVKSKFAGFLRGLIGRADHRASARQVAPTQSAPAPVPAVKSTTTTPAPVAPPRGGNPDEIELPLANVVAGLPLDLKAKLIANPMAGQTIHLQADMVISQLAFGAVKIPFGELRKLAPGAFVNSGGELDSKLISLPLQEILPRLNPALLSRRSARKVEVSAEIVGPFAERGRGFSFTTQPLKGPAAQPLQPAAPTPAPEAAPAPAPAAPIAFTPPAGVRQTTPPPFTPPIPQRSITPAAPSHDTSHVLEDAGHSHAIPVSPLSPSTPRSITPAGGTNGSNGHANGNGASNGNGNGGNGIAMPPGLRLASTGANGTNGTNGNGNNGSAHADAPPLKMSASTPAPIAPIPSSPRTAPTQPTFFAPLTELCEGWPEALRNEIHGSPLAEAKVPLDGNLIIPGLKRGKVVMTWKQIRVLIQPASAPSPNDNLELELPLKVIAPLFVSAAKSAARTQTKMSVSAEIPDLFFGFPQPSAPPVAPPVIPPLPRPQEAVPEPVIPPMLKPAEKMSPAPKHDTNFFVWTEKGEAPAAEDTATICRAEVPQTDFMNRQAHPKEVVDKARALPGVAGSVVAMQDGLRVASEVPTELNADTLAAFLPQIFERVNQSTRELRMGALNNVNFTVGNVPWKIFRVNAVYFAAFGRAGESLPSAQLAQLAAELDRKK